MERILRVSRKGQIAIPVEVRKKFGIGSTVILKVTDNEVKIVPVKSFEESFGIDGERMLKVARAHLADKKRELELEK